MSNWNEQQLKHLANTGKIRGYNFHNNSGQNMSKKPVKNIPARKSKEKEWLEFNLAYFCNENALTLSSEHQFDKTRKWRFDHAIESLMVALEYEGIFSTKSRHTTITGFTGDIDKYNHAQRLGWTIYRYTSKNYKDVLGDLRNHLKNRNG